MDSEELPESLYDLGVLFVHGIGQSEQGETLVRFGEALRDSVERHVKLAESKSKTDRESKFDVTAVTAAWLSSLDGDQPARAELKIRGCQAATPVSGTPVDSRWLLAEAWWAEKFPTPTYEEIVTWSFEVLPATVLAHFDLRFRRVRFAAERSLLSSHSRRNYLGALAGLQGQGAALVLALALTPLVLAAIALLLLLGLAPFAAVRDLAGALQRKLAATIGDSYVFMRQPIIAATICTSVRERLEWLAARCHKVAVVAHSQGGAIAHQVLHGTLTAPCDLLITFGSGLAKLSEWKRGKVGLAQVKLWVAVIGGALATLGFLAFLVLGWASNSAIGWVISGAIAPFILEMGVLVLFVAIVRRSKDAKPSQTSRFNTNTPVDEAEKRAKLRWRDLLCRPFGFALSVALSVGVLFLVANIWWTLGPSTLWLNVSMAFVLAFGLALAYEAISAWHRESGRSANPSEQWRLDRKLFNDDFGLYGRSIYWDDLYATADPVSNGQLLDDFRPPEMSSMPVRNMHSLLLDHTSYWQAADDFVQRVTRSLLRLAGLSTRDDLDGDRAVLRRAWRVGWLRAARWAIGLAVLALAADWWVSPPVSKAEFVNFMRRFVPIQPQWTEYARDFFPLLAAPLLWLLSLRVLHLIWRYCWDRVEVESYLKGHDYTLGSRGFWCALATPIVLAVAAVIAWSGNTAFLVLPIIAVAIFFSRSRWEEVLQLPAVSGRIDKLEERRKERLLKRLERAACERDSETLTSVALELYAFAMPAGDPSISVRSTHQLKSRMRDATRALDGLCIAAFVLRQANAAWELGRIHEEFANTKHDKEERKQAYERAVKAYEQGAELGDLFCARFAAKILENKLNKRDEAMKLYKRAFALGDRDAASAGDCVRVRGEARQAEMIEKEKKLKKVRRYCQRGFKRRDSHSAFLLARDFEDRAKKARGDEAAKLNSRADQCYRLSFEWGLEMSAWVRGDLLRKDGNVSGARSAYMSGARFRNTFAALKLGTLEREEHNEEAAQRAFRRAAALFSYAQIEDRPTSDMSWELEIVGANVSAELHSLLIKEGKPRAAKKLVDRIFTLRPDFVLEVAECMEKQGSSEAANELRDRLKDLERKQGAIAQGV